MLSMESLLYLILSTLAGLVCYLFAKEKGKEKPIAWFWLGFFLNIIAIIIIMAIKKVRKG